jgi:hypothetical protein
MVLCWFYKAARLRFLSAFGFERPAVLTGSADDEGSRTNGSRVAATDLECIEGPEIDIEVDDLSRLSMLKTSLTVPEKEVPSAALAPTIQRAT